MSDPMDRPQPASWPTRALSFTVCHFCVLLYGYFGFGLVVCALCAPDDRIAALHSHLIGRGWHLAVLAVALLAPVPALYVWRWRRAPQG